MVMHGQEYTPAYHMSDNTFQPGRPPATGYLSAEEVLYNGPDTPYDNVSPTINAFQEHFSVFDSALDSALDPAFDDLSSQRLLLQTAVMPHASLPQPAARQIPTRQAALSVEEESLWAALGPPIQAPRTNLSSTQRTEMGRRVAARQQDGEYDYA